MSYDNDTSQTGIRCKDADKVFGSRVFIIFEGKPVQRIVDFMCV